MRSRMAPDELVAAFPDRRAAPRNPFALRTVLSHRGMKQDVVVIPDFAFALSPTDGSLRYFLVEIDRGTMPDARSDTFRQTSFEEKMRAYLTAHAGKQHERQFGWKTFRVLTVTTDHRRMQSMMEALRKLRIPQSPLLFHDARRASDQRSTRPRLPQCCSALNDAMGHKRASCFIEFNKFGQRR